MWTRIPASEGQRDLPRPPPREHTIEVFGPADIGLQAPERRRDLLWRPRLADGLPDEPGAGLLVVCAVVPGKSIGGAVTLEGLGAAVVPTSGLVAVDVVPVAVLVVGETVGVVVAVLPVSLSVSPLGIPDPGAVLGSHLLVGEELLGVLLSVLHDQIDVLLGRIGVGHDLVVVAGRLQRGHPSEDAGHL